MTTTPLMSLILPTEGGSADTWDTILDTAFGLIDSHNHTTGNGAKIPTGALKIDADIPWSLGGVSRAITELRAIDFSAQPAADMTALLGALFLNSADNELYYRTTAGANVKLTSGAALNVVGFSGGIGGDYSAVGALVSYDDVTDSYLFRQEVGAGVRQYARMRSADLDLFEYKAAPTAGVPTNRVRLQSPTALAASYALTLPAALPGSQSTLQVSTAGVVSAVSTFRQIQLPASMCGAISPAGFTGSTGRLDFNGSSQEQPFPLPLEIGSTITAWGINVIKDSNGTHTLTARLVKNEISTGAVIQIGSSQSTSAAGPGAKVLLGQSGLSELVSSLFTYRLTCVGDGLTLSDSVDGYAVSLT